MGLSTKIITACKLLIIYGKAPSLMFEWVLDAPPNVIKFTKEFEFIKISWLIFRISFNNHMFDGAIWDKLPECFFENIEFAWVKRGQFQNMVTG